MVEKKEYTTIDKKEHIVNTAIELFADRGFEGTSMRDLAAAAEVNIAMINYYFGSKENLLNSMVEYRVGYSLEALEEIVKDNTLTPLKKIRKAVAIHLESVRENLKFHKIVYHEIMLSQRPETNEVLRKLLTKKKQTLVNIIEEGIKSGDFRSVDIQLTLASIFGVVNQVYLSKTICKMYTNDDPSYDPYTDAKFQKRISDYMNNLIDSLLLNK